MPSEEFRHFFWMPKSCIVILSMLSTLQSVRLPNARFINQTRRQYAASYGLQKPHPIAEEKRASLAIVPIHAAGYQTPGTETSYRSNAVYFLSNPASDSLVGASLKSPKSFSRAVMAFAKRVLGFPAPLYRDIRSEALLLCKKRAFLVFRDSRLVDLLLLEARELLARRTHDRI